MAYVYGVDIGGTAIKVGLFDLSGALLDRWELPTRREDHGAEILPDLARWIRAQPIRLSELVGVGVGIPGPVVDGTVYGCVNLGWETVPVAQSLSRLLDGVCVRAGNDANVAALGECWQGAGTGRQNLLLVTLGTGVGCGVVVDGVILPGAHGAAGELGHVQVRADEEERCGCGKRGCLEQYASATGIVRLARQKGLALSEPLTAKAVLDAARGGDPVARQVAEEAGTVLGLALSWAACLLDPELILLGGGVARAGDVLLDPVRAQYRRSVFHRARETEFALAALGNDAGIYGAARLIETAVSRDGLHQ